MIGYRSWTRLGILAAALVVSAPAAADPRGWDKANSIGRDLLVASALGVPATQGDWTVSLQAGGSMIKAGGATYGLTRLFPETRRDKSYPQSFPLGHTGTSFAAAATLEDSYGCQVALPVLAVATFVGFARVRARKRNWYDAVVDAAIGTGSGFLLIMSVKANYGLRRGLIGVTAVSQLQPIRSEHVRH